MAYLPLVGTIFLLYLCQVSGAVTHVFVLKGEDVTLDVEETKDLKNLLVFSWNFNTKDALVTFLRNNEPEVSPVYTGRIEFTVKKYSVTLKNLQEDDSGVYTARGRSTVEEDTLAEYKVTVQAPVSPVELTVDSVSKSSGSCNLTVSCSTQGSHINSTFRCDGQTCSQEGGEQSEVTTSGASLRFYLENDSIICNHSNQVSRTKNMTEIHIFCPGHFGLEQPNNNIYFLLILLLIPVSAAVILVLRQRQRQRGQTMNMEHTEYVTVQAGRENVLTPINDDSAESPLSIYSLAGPQTGLTDSIKARSITEPETLYASVSKPGRS